MDGGSESSQDVKPNISMPPDASTYRPEQQLEVIHTESSTKPFHTRTVSDEPESLPPPASPDAMLTAGFEIPANLEEQAIGDEVEEDITNDAEQTIQTLTMDKANLERQNFNINLELTEAKTKIQDLSTKHQVLHEQVASQANLLDERVRLYREIEASRNDLASRTINLEVEVSKIKIEKEERDSLIKTLNKDKSAFAAEVIGLKEKLKEACDDSALLKVQLQDFTQSKIILAHERDKSQCQRELFEKSKQWFRNEIQQKDSKIEEIRCELNARECRWQAERMATSRELQELRCKVEDLEEKLTAKQDMLKKAFDNVEIKAEQHRMEIQTFEKDVHSKNELINLLKQRAERAEDCLQDYEAQFKSRDELLHNTRLMLEELRKDMDTERDSFVEQIKQKDEQISELTMDLEKANACIRNKHSVSINLTEDELAKLSPAAAETSKILKSGMSLTSMMREQANLAGELEAERSRRKQLEEELNEIVRHVEERVPDFFRQKDQIDQLFDENSKLHEQVELADESRRKLQGELDSALRELRFTNGELQKAQVMTSELAKKQQQLVFVLEKERQSRDNIELTDAEGVELFDSIGKLQRRNLQLEAELAAERSSAVEAAVAVHNAEIEKLNKELTASRESEDRLNIQLTNLTATLDELKYQCENLEKLVQENTNTYDLRLAQLKADECLAKLQETERKLSHAEGSLAVFKEKLSAAEKHQADTSSGYRKDREGLLATIAKLEAKFEQQKQISDTLMQDVQTAEKKATAAQKESDNLMSSNRDLSAKANSLHEEIFAKQQKLDETKREFAVTKYDLEMARSELSFLQTQLSALQEQKRSTDLLMTSVSQMSERLCTVQAELHAKANDRQEVLQLECEQLKNLLARANDQLAQARNESKTIQTRQEQELSVMAQQVVEKGEQLRVTEQALTELRVQLSSIQSQFASEHSTEGMSPERLKKEYQQLKNREQYLEKQCEELKKKTSDAENENSKLRQENDKLSVYSGKVETGLAESKKLAELEISRLEARGEAAEKRAESLSVSIGELRTILDERDSELTNTRIQHVEEQTTLQQRVSVLEQQLRDVEHRLSISEESKETLKRDLDQKLNEVSQLQAQFGESDSVLAEANTKLILLESKLVEKQKELNAAQELAELAETTRKSAEIALALQSATFEEEQKKYCAAVEEHDKRLQEIMGQYNEVINKMGSGIEQEPALAEESIVDPDVPQAVIQSQQNVMRFLRAERESASERAMRAEVELSRLRAEVQQIQSSRNELTSEIGRLRVQASVASEALVEKAELLKKVETLTNSHMQLARLKADKENLQKIATELQKKNKETEASIASLQGEKEQISIQLTAAQAEVGARKRDAELWKQKAETMKKQTPSRPTEARVSQLESENQELKNRTELAEKHARQSEEKLNKANERAEQTRQVAIRYKNMYTELQKKSGAGGGASSTGADSGAAAQIADLEAKLAASTETSKKLMDQMANEAEESQSRLLLLQGLVSRSDSTIKEKDAIIAQLQRQIENSRGGMKTALVSQEAHPAPPTPALSVPREFSSVPIDPSFARADISAGTSIPSASISDTLIAEPICTDVFDREVDELRSSEDIPAAVLIDENPAVPHASSSSTTLHSVPFGSGTTGADSAKANDSSIKVLFSAVDRDSAAGQSSLISGSALIADIADEAQNGSGGADDSESRDSLSVMPVSSSGSSRKRGPSGMMETTAEAKRQRNSPHDAVTSSEEPVHGRAHQRAHENEGDDTDAGDLPMIEEIEDDNDIEIPSNNNERQQLQEEIVIDDESDESHHMAEDLEDENEMEDEEEDDEEESDREDERDEDTGDSEDDYDQEPDNGDADDNEDSRGIVVESSDGEDVSGNQQQRVDGNDEEVHGFEESSVSQPTVEDREAASAIEEADDEGRNSADGSATIEASDIPSGSGMAQRSHPMLRIPVIAHKPEGEDQCSSSNEGESIPLRTQPVTRGNRARRSRGRGESAIYRPPAFARRGKQ